MRRDITRRPLTAIVVAGCALAFAACGDAAENGIEQLIESQGGGDVDLDLDGDGGISVQTEEGGMTLDENGNFVITDADGSVVTGEVDADTGEVNVESEDGSFSSGATTQLPDEWPAEIPEPNGVTIASATMMGSDGEQVITVSGTVDGDEFVESYASSLASAGFEEVSTFSSDGTINNVYSNDQWTVGVLYYGEDSENQVTVSVFSN